MLQEAKDNIHNFNFLSYPMKWLNCGLVRNGIVHNSATNQQRKLP